MYRLQVAVFCCVLVGLVFQVTAGAHTGGADDCQSCIKHMASLRTLGQQINLQSGQGLCDLMGPELGAICRHTFQNGSPRDICIIIGQCAERVEPETPSDLTFSSEILPNDETDVTDLDESFVCHICKTVVHLVKHLLEEHHATRAILNSLKMLCHLVSFIRTTCIHMVDMYGAMLIHIMKSFIHKGICTDLLHCARTTAMSAESECSMCQVGTGIVRDALTDPELEARIRLYAHDFCQTVDKNDYTCMSAAREVALSLKQVAGRLRETDALKHVCKSTGMCN